MSTFAHTFTVTPPPRVDTHWTLAHIEEAAVIGGPFTVIQTLAIPVDATPATPDPVEVTTTMATLPVGFYRVQFEDGAGVLSPYSAAIRDPSASALAATDLTVAELKRRMDIKRSTSDEVLEGYLASALAQAQAPPPNGCGRLLVPDPLDIDADAVQRTFRTKGCRPIAIPDAREITEVLVDDVQVTDYEWLEVDGVVVALDLPSTAVTDYAGAPVTRVVKVTGRFGIWPLPENLKDAIYTLAARAHYEASAMYADQVAIADGSGVQSYYRQLPPRTKLVFGSFALAEGVGLTL